MEDVALYAMGLHPEIMKSADLVVGLPGKDPFDLLEAAAEKYLFGSCAYYLLAARCSRDEARRPDDGKPGQDARYGRPERR